MGETYPESKTLVFRWAMLNIILICLGQNLKFDYTKLYSVSYAVIPLLVEVAVVTIISMLLTDIGLGFSILMGVCISAVSPSILIKELVKLQKQKYGMEDLIPKLIFNSAVI